MPTTPDATTPDPVQALRSAIQAWDQGAWCLAALALCLGANSTDEQRSAGAEVLRAAGVPQVADRSWLPGTWAKRIAGQAQAPLMQIAALLADPTSRWAQQPDEALISQGQASAQSAPLFAQLVLPHLEGLAERLDNPGARMLDVGVGVAAQAIAFCQVFPQLTVVGIDVLPRALELAARAVTVEAVVNRVMLRDQDVTTLAEEAHYDLGFVPAPFLPPVAFHAGLPKVAVALKPGGWLCLGHGKFVGHPLEDSLTKLKTSAYGGTALDDHEAQDLMTRAGLTEVRTVPTPPGAPAITIGRRPTSM